MKINSLFKRKNMMTNHYKPVTNVGCKKKYENKFNEGRQETCLPAAHIGTTHK